jgi:hypothetical protein
MAIQSADGLARAKGATDQNAGPVSTPAPTADQSRSTSFGRTNYGSNAFDGPSSLTPGKKLNAGLKVNADDGVMQTILEKGLEPDTTLNSQLRDIGKNAPPDAWGMESNRARQASTHSASAATVPGAISKTPSAGAGKP